MRLSRRADLILRGLSGLTLAFIYIPLLVIFIYAFNTSRVLEWPPPGLTLEWFGDALTNSGARDAFLLSSSATYTHASFTASGGGYGEGDLLPYVPQLVLRTDASAKKTVARVLGRDLEARVGTGLEGLVGRPLPFGETGRNVFLVDASAGLRLKEIELGLDVFNLLDARWYDGQFVYPSNFTKLAAPARVPFRHVTIGAPRTLLLSLTLHV